MKRQTFSVRQESRCNVLRGYMDPDNGAYVVCVDPVETPTEGGKHVSIGFPVLIVTAWVKDPEVFARRVAELLTEHQS